MYFHILISLVSVCILTLFLPVEKKYSTITSHTLYILFFWVKFKLGIWSHFPMETSIWYILSPQISLLGSSDGTQVPDLGLKPGFFPFERVGFFSLKTRVPGFPIFKILMPKNAQISTKYSSILVKSLQNSSIFWWKKILIIW